VTNQPWPEINRTPLEAVFHSDAYVGDPAPSSSNGTADGRSSASPSSGAI
jgi:hypothetical protein